jgi:hypothetical protein
MQAGDISRRKKVKHLSGLHLYYFYPVPNCKKLVKLMSGCCFLQYKCLVHVSVTWFKGI